MALFAGNPAAHGIIHRGVKMSEAWSILYRGPLSSCNYDCPYCPFRKTAHSREQLREDAACLERFVDWVESRRETIHVLFTPWGEALLHRHYQKALSALSRLAHVQRVAIQTNLACALDWLEAADPGRLAFWCTFHPGQTTLDRFLAQCDALDALGFRFSVGVVGVREAFGWLAPLRQGLPPHVYLWVNAFKDVEHYYSAPEIAFLEQWDPWFRFNLTRHPSRGRACNTGHRVFSVDGHGQLRRCHFVPEIIGNIYQTGFESALRPRPCPADSCGCHIGYAHLPHLGLDKVFGDGLLERIPQA